MREGDRCLPPGWIREACVSVDSMLKHANEQFVGKRRKAAHIFDDFEVRLCGLEFGLDSGGELAQNTNEGP